MGQITSIEEATVLAERFLESSQGRGLPGMNLPEGLTQEHDFGWVFFNGPVHAGIGVAGNAPFIVSRLDGSIHVTGTSHPTERNIESFARIGRTYPFAEARCVVTLDGWRPGLQKISLTKLIRKFSTLDLARAKQFTDDVEPVVDSDNVELLDGMRAQFRGERQVDKVKESRIVAGTQRDRDGRKLARSFDSHTFATC